MKQENNQKLRSIPPPVPPNPHCLLYRCGGIHQELPVASRLPELESSTLIIQIPSCGIRAK